MRSTLGFYACNVVSIGNNGHKSLSAFACLASTITLEVMEWYSDFFGGGWPDDAWYSCLMMLQEIAHPWLSYHICRHWMGSRYFLFWMMAVGKVLYSVEKPLCHGRCWWCSHPRLGVFISHRVHHTREEVVAEQLLVVNPSYLIMVGWCCYATTEWCLALRSVLSTSGIWPN